MVFLCFSPQLCKETILKKVGFKITLHVCLTNSTKAKCVAMCADLKYAFYILICISYARTKRFVWKHYHLSLYTESNSGYNPVHHKLQERSEKHIGIY